MEYVFHPHRDAPLGTPERVDKDMPTKKEILAALGAIIDPDLQQDIVSLGFVKNLRIHGGKVSFTLELTSPTCSIKEQFKTQAEEIVRRLPGVTGVRVTLSARRRAPGEAPGSDCACSGGASALSITEKALAAMEELDLPDGGFVRLSVVPGGCSGHTYSATVDDDLSRSDLVLYEEGPLRIVTDPDSVDFLEGVEIDYSDDLIRSGFRFSNPNARGACGCGSSFEV